MNKNITILAFSLNHGGAEKVCLSLCNEFVKQDFDLELWIVNFKETELTKRLDKRIKVFPMNESRVRKSILPLTKLLLKRKPERVLVFHIELAILMIILKRIFFLKTRVIVRSINTLSQAFNYPEGIWEKYIAKRAVKLFLPYSDKIIAQSTGMYVDLMKNFGITGDRVTVIPNPVEFYVNGFSAEIKPVYRNEFLFVGRLKQQKGLTNMLEAFKMASLENDDMHLTVVGDGPQRDKLEKLVDDLNLAGKVTFEGYQADALPYYLRAKATLLTSFFEGFPNVLVESIAAGTPVISFDCPSGPEDIIIPGVNGILVPHLNIPEFARAVLAVAGGKVKFNRQKVAESAKRFSAGLIANKYTEVYFKN